MQLSQYTPMVTPVTYEEYKTGVAKRAAGNNDMDQQAFLNLLITQMKNQDPLSPMDNAEFTQQTTAFSQLEQMIAMNKTLETLLKAQSGNEAGQNELLSSAAYIGKIIEYDTNRLEVSSSGASPISFYSTGQAPKGEARVYNSDGVLMTVVSLDSIKKGANSFTWDGKGSGGVELPEGNYYYEVNAIGDNGEKVEIGTYGKSEVTGVRISGGKLYFEVNNGLVPATDVYSVKAKIEVDTGEEETDKLRKIYK